MGATRLPSASSARPAATVARRPPVLDTTVIVCPDRQHIAERAVDLLVDGLRAAIARRGEAHLALTGGSSAEALFGALCSGDRSQRVDWGRVHVWQGDERFVPWSHPDSNWSAARRGWLDHPDGPAIPAGQLHPIPVDEAIASGRDVAWAAERYSGTLTTLLPQVEGLPAFDVVLLGVGSDGHILSTFPGTVDPATEAPAAMAVEAPTHIKPHVARVTLAPHLLRVAGLVIVMVPGTAKADVVAACFSALRDPVRLPAQQAVRPNAVWLLEPGSAAGL
jgi:6-phosphogluconolactonase